MTTAEKLRFLADRMEDGKEFTVSGYVGKFRYVVCGLIIELTYNGKKITVGLDIEDLIIGELSIVSNVPRLSADDSAFLKLAKDCGYGEWWIARDRDGTVVLFHRKPTMAEGNHWWSRFENACFPLHIHSPLLNIKWEDDDCYTVNQLLGEKE